MKSQVKDELNKFQGELITALRQELAATRIQENPTPSKSGGEEDDSKRYLHIARNSTKSHAATNRDMASLPVQSRSELGTAAVATYQAEKLMDLYFFMNYVGNLGAIRRAITHEIFNERGDKILNYNPHPSPRAGIGQVIFLKANAKQIIAGSRKAGINQLPDKYVPMEVSPRSRHIGLGRVRGTKENSYRCVETGKGTHIAQEMKRLLSTTTI